MDTVLELIKLGVVGLVAGTFTAVLANRDHKNRAYWEMRVAAYKGTIENLSDIIYYYQINYDAAVEYRELPEELKEKMRSFWHNSFHGIRKSADSGAFLFSNEANAALKRFIDSCNNEDDSYVEALDCQLFAAKICLSELVKLSKVDLRLNKSLLGRLG